MLNFQGGHIYIESFQLPGIFTEKEAEMIFSEFGRLKMYISIINGKPKPYHLLQFENLINRTIGNQKIETCLGCGGNDFKERQIPQNSAGISSYRVCKTCGKVKL